MDTQSDIPNTFQDQLPVKTAGWECSPFQWWSIEILCCIASAGCLGSIVALLILYDGKPQESWSSNVLTLNGLVALLATLCRTFFMVAISAALAQGKWNQLSGRNDASHYQLRDFAIFDDAAKGPWGSAKLLWRFKGFHIACLGAALSILSLAFGLFSQQLIGLRTIEITNDSVGATGRVPRATFVDTMKAGSIDPKSLLPSTKLAIYEGYMAENVDFLQTTCPTGNCDWPIIPTLGVCGACVNTTDEIIIDGLGGSCNVSTPSGIKFTGGCGNEWEGTKFMVGAGSGKVFSLVPEAPGHSEAPHIIVDFGALGIPPGVNNTMGPLHEGLVATDCALWYCLQAHKVSVVEGKLTDEIVKTWSKVNESEGLESYNFLQAPSEPFNLDPDERYYIAQHQMSTVQDYLSNQNISGTVARYLPTYHSTTDFADGMYSAFDDPVSWIERFAWSMTNEVRSLGDRYAQLTFSAEPPDVRTYASQNVRYRGTARSSQVFVTVSWFWLTYPALMVLLTVVFRVFEATRTSFQKDIRAWKDDSMVPLCINLDERVREIARTGFIEPKGAMKLVGDHELRITRGANGFLTGFAPKED
ncbi:unnamed protein product [Colletotrichum noveboracense]|uniref:Uncharacterized protein n=1 Tax=Colletotrichum noveboracense TaxID=2664923 RepID=A0A9W4RNP6_9PEZI|nr:hypothetical protein CBS470a_008572 [Colletotrichum nupharicola]CAI0644526.1 unnamed protein product [Colletotrichum noveboracense]